MSSIFAKVYEQICAYSEPGTANAYHEKAGTQYHYYPKYPYICTDT